MYLISFPAGIFCTRGESSGGEVSLRHCVTRKFAYNLHRIYIAKICNIIEFSRLGAMFPPPPPLHKGSMDLNNVMLNNEHKISIAFV